MQKILDALDRLDDGRHWIKGSGYDGQGWCLLGALGNSKSGDYMVCVYDCGEEVAAVARVICAQFPERIPSFLTPEYSLSICRSFNDNRATTWDDVRVVLEKASIGS